MRRPNVALATAAAAPRLRRVLLVAGLALAALPAAPALADTTIGQTGSTPGGNCLGPTVTADANYVVPSGGGTITSFSYESVAANAGQQLDFLVLRPTATADTYTVVGKTGLVTLAGTGLETFTANVPVQEGDILGFWNPGSLTACGRSAPGAGGLIGTNIDLSGDPAVGAEVFMDFANPNFDLNLSANLVTLPTSKAQCKKGGWKTFGVFKNQGDCVSFVSTKGKNPPSGSNEPGARARHRR